MTSRYADLDEFLAESTGDPVELKLFGEIWQLPPSVPADLMIRVERLYAFIAERLEGDPQATIPDDLDLDIMDTAQRMCGAENVAQWMERRLDRNQLWGVVFRVMAIHNGRVDEKPEGKPKAPKKGRSGSTSHTGGRSKRTSDASTGSGSPASSAT